MAEEARPDSGVVLPLLKLAVFTVLVPGSVTVWMPYYFYLSRGRWGSLAFGSHTLAGIALLVLGTSGYLWCALDFAFTGRGTPAPIDPPKVLVARGLYRHVRNPMYISVLLVLLGESVLFSSVRLLRYAGIVAVGFHLFVLLYEEPALHNKFGTSYEEYCRIVPRWIPRLRA